MPPTTFVQIAAYRDPQLLPTVVDCCRKARYPERLRFCVAFQFGPGERFEPPADLNARFHVVNIPAEESRGLGWARNITQQGYDGETFTMCLDSHHRFTDGWDEYLYGAIKKLKAKVDKPMLTTYAPAFDPEKEELVPAVQRIVFERFLSEGKAMLFRPEFIEEKITEPEPAKFLSAHFFFVEGEFCQKVPHDPKVYFLGEESGMSIRAFTHGYDMFHPDKNVMWHEYTRKGRPKHWDDHKKWVKMHEESVFQHKALVEGKLTEYGLGKKRTLAEYEKFAGVNFEKLTVEGKAPHTVRIPVDVKGWEEHQFWCVALHDDGGEVYRQDASQEEIRKAVEDGFIERTFVSGRKAFRWILWPYHKADGWVDRQENDLKL